MNDFCAIQISTGSLLSSHPFIPMNMDCFLVKFTRQDLFLLSGWKIPRLEFIVAFCMDFSQAWGMGSGVLRTTILSVRSTDRSSN